MKICSIIEHFICVFCSIIEQFGRSLKSEINLSLYFGVFRFCFTFAIEMTDKVFRFFIGGLAQLARALAWHARGRRFDPDTLHPIVLKVCKVHKVYARMSS